ncbi:OmpL47-type beta-barrel domain-containing protein [Treponema primitia]|uniref:OmpL47-type beta-barrel domain-containing protein n=1 Tax=Treponema primitia TaxID=88058 RepID=UPI0002554D8E|nr:putative Ig domain-containing protein [Treponema primitia]
MKDTFRSVIFIWLLLFGSLVSTRADQCVVDNFFDNYLVLNVTVAGEAYFYKGKYDVYYNAPRSNISLAISATLKISKAYTIPATIEIFDRDTGQCVETYYHTGDAINYSFPSLPRHAFLRIFLAPKADLYNFSTYGFSYYIDCDTSAPSVTAEYKGSVINDTLITNTTSEKIKLIATDDLSGVNEKSWMIKDSNLEWLEYSEPNVYPIEGIHNFRISVMDNVNNMTSKTIMVIADMTGPVVTITANPPNGWTNGSGVELTAAGYDPLSDVDPKTWQFSTNYGSSWSPEGELNNQVTITKEGSTEVRFRVKDKVGNIGSGSIICGVDKRIPTVRVVSGNIGDAWSANPQGGTLVFSASDLLPGLARIEYSRDDGASWTSLSVDDPSPRVTIIEEGRNRVIFRAIDKAGNEAMVEGNINIDTRPPEYTLSIDGCARKESNGWIIPLRVSDIYDASSGFNYDSLKYTLDGGSPTKLSGSVSGSVYNAPILAPFLSGRDHSLKISGADRLGNTREQTLAFSSDLTAPVIRAGSTLGKTAEECSWTNRDRFEYLITDTESGVKTYSVELSVVLPNGFLSATNGYTVTESGVIFKGEAPDGIYNVLIKAVDNANNIGEEVFFYKLDRHPPEISPLLIKSIAAYVTITGTDKASGLDKNCWSGSTGGVSGTAGYTIELPEGLHERTFTLRDIAGNSTTKKVTIYVDQSPPEITLHLPEYGAAEKLPLTIDARDNLTEISGQWYILDGVKTVLDKAHWKSIDIPLNSYAEGFHTIRSGAVDEVGNSGESGDYQFIIDRTPPELRSFELRDAVNRDRIIGKDDYIGYGSVLVKITGEDRFIHNSEAKSGVIKSYFWDVKQNAVQAPVFVSQRRSAENEFTIGNLNEGLNYLHIRAEDGAGNLSNILNFTVLQDQRIPGSPMIRSTTHAEANRSEQASSLSRAEFNFSPAFEMKSGISGYQWKVEKLLIQNGYEGSPEFVREGQITEIDQEGKGQLSIELDDNGEDEFYNLFVQCIGGNTKTGSWAKYRFRIDTEAPGELRIQTVPQADSSRWYNQWNVLIRWNKPSDMTGVSEYRYILLPQDEPLEEPWGDISSWNPTTDMEVQMDLRNILGGKKSGRVQIGVCAIDYAGNRKFGVKSFGYDFAPPEFGSNYLTITDAEDYMGKGKSISWEGLGDGESGIDHITILVADEDRIRTYTVGPEAAGYIVTPLDEDRVYTVVVRGYDGAGNQAELYAVCATGSAVIPDAYSIPYLENINGYQLSGKKHISPEGISFEDITLQVPDTLAVYTITVIEGLEVRNPLREILLEELNVKDGVIEKGQTGQGRYGLRSGEFTLEGERFSLDRTGGMSLGEAVYTRPMVIAGLQQERTINLGSVTIGFPPLIQLSSGSAAIGVPVHITSTAKENPGFTLTGVESLALRNGKEWFDGNDISFNKQYLASRLIYLESPVEGGSVRLKDSSMEEGSRNLSARLDIPAAESLNLTLGKAVYTVKKGGIRGSSLEIYEAALSLPVGYEPRELMIRNFTIDSWNGIVHHGPDFFAENIKITSPSGVVFEGTKIEFDIQGNLLVSGIISSEIYGAYRTENTILTNSGIDWETGAEITGFTTDIHGFLVNAGKAWLTTAGILISEGIIDVWDNQQVITGLGLGNNRKDEVWQNGIIRDVFFGDPGYGSQIQINAGKITADGFLGNAFLPLGNGITDQAGGGYWDFPGVQLNPNGAITGEYEGEKLFIIAGNLITAENISFDGGQILIGKGRIEGVLNLNPGNITFTGMTLDYRGISTEGLSGSSFKYYASGWEIRYESLAFDGLGIKGRGSLRLPEKLGGLSIEFPEARISADGLLTSGTLDGIQDILRFQNVPLSADGVSLKVLNGNYVFEIAYPLVSLKEINGPDILFGGVIFDPDGMVLTGNNEERRFNLTASNGYVIGVENSRIENDGLILDGVLFLQWPGQNIAIPGGKYRILPDYRVSGTALNTELVYQFGDWSIRGRDIKFDVDRIRIGTNRILFREIEIDIGEIPLSIDGQLLQQVVQTQDLRISLLGTVAKISETRFSDKGIEAGMIIVLPAYLGGKSFTFDTVGFKPDGGFWIEKKIDQLDFTALNFTFSIKSVTLDKLGLHAEQASIVLPESMERVSISVHDLRIANTGTVSIENTEISPFTLWNMHFTLNNFSIVNEEVNFSGSIRLPEVMPGELSAREIQIRDFRVDLGGGILSLDVCLNGEYTVPFTGVWNLLFRDVRVIYSQGQPWITAELVKLVFPLEYMVQNARVDQVKFNPLTGEFAFSDITISTNIFMNFLGVDFSLNEVQIQSGLAIKFIGSAHFANPEFPAFIAGKTAKVNSFEIRSDGNLGTIDISLDGLEGGIIPGVDGIVLKKGHVALRKEGAKSLTMDIGGNITLNSSMPAGLVGAALKIETFTYDIAAMEITRLKASVVLPTANSLGNLFTKLSIGIDWNEKKQTGFLNLSGNLILPACFPAFLYAKEVKISNFKIGFDGAIQSFSAKYSTEKNKPYDAFQCVQLSDVVIEISLKSGVMEFDLAGTVILPANKFPQGIGGLRTSIAMKFDTVSGLKSAAASAVLPAQKLFGSMELRNGMLGISKPAGKPLEISVGGELVFPDFFPVGLRGLAVGIQKFTINTYGEILDVNIAASGITAKIFGMVDLSNGSINFRKGLGQEFLINIGGSIQFSSTGLPDGIRNSSMVIRTLELSTRDGLMAFDAGLGSEIVFSILGGIRVNFNRLNLSESGISISGSAKLPSSYPKGLANTEITMRALKLGWNGSIQDINGGIGAWYMTLVGFTATIEELFFEKDASGQFLISLKSCKIQLPQGFGDFGGQYIGIKNAKIRPSDGAFLGDIEMSKVETEIAGFKLVMEKPALEFSENLISFSKVSLKFPDFIGKGDITLNKVKLSASEGLQISGGAFKLPNFSVGTLTFNDVKVSFASYTTGYTLEGGGSVIIPGAGNITAYLGFATISPTYSIGLKQAYFSYVLATGGIPLGNSGLFLNGISGGIAYGPPDEVPQPGKGLFNDMGPRIAVGLHVGDAYGGTILDMTPAAWVDIKNGTWAFEGKAMILKGKLDINARLSAAMGSKGFVGEVYVKLAFVEGGVTVYVFDKSGRTIFSGQGGVKFGISKGAIINTSLIMVPESNTWLVEVNAEFGQFSNGKSGFKGTVELPVIGTVGVFVGPGQFDFGSLSSYKIEKPSWIKDIRSFGDQDINSLDRSDRSGNEDVSYRFFIPPKGKEITAPLSMLYEEYNGTEKIPDSGLDRLIVLLEYIEGAPQLTVSSPSGMEYREGYEGTETIVGKNGIVLVIHSAEAGIWQLRVSGLEEDAYQLSALGSMAMPMLELHEPAVTPERVNGTVRVRGITEQGKTGIRIFAREEMELPGLELGTYAIDPNGQFDLMVPVQDLYDGEYFIYAQLEGPEDYLSPAAYAPGKILLDRSALPMLAPGELRIAETDPEILTLHWHNTNGGRTEGYKVKIRENGGETESIVYVGNITALSLPGYTPDQEISFAVTALDNKYQAGPWSDEISFRPGQEKPVFNRPVALAERFREHGFIGNFIEGILRARIENFHESTDASGYIGVRYTGPEQNQFLNMHFASPVKVSETTVEIPWYMGVSESMGPGLYEYTCEFFNEANSALNSPFTLAVEISWPVPEVTAVEPSEINGVRENILTVYGSGFVPGTRVFWGDEELIILNDGTDTSSGTMRVILPPRSGIGLKQNSTEEGKIIIQGPGGERALFPITVLLPGYRVSLYTRTAETIPGGKVDYALGISPVNGFEGAVSFKVLDKPEELEIVLPVITVNAIENIAENFTGLIGIYVRENTKAGSYSSRIEGEGGRVFELVTNVRDIPPVPALTSVVPRAAYTGDEVHIYGYGLGSQGTLFLNGQDVPVSRWSDGELIFVVPDNGLSGKIHVLSSGGESNALAFTVKDRGFDMHPGTERLELNAGEEKILPIVITGYADTVTLSVVCEPGAPFTAFLDREELKPNERLNLRIRAESFAGNGVWNIVIHGTSRGFESTAEITVHIGSSFSITTTNLPDGLVEVSYYGELSSRNAGGEVEYHVKQGSLPPGLTMTPQGIISGRPLEQGQYQVDIEAQDRMGWKDGRSFTITIWEEVWGQEGKDGGKTWSVRTDLPANDDTAWIYEGKDPVIQILGAENKIIALGRESLSILMAGDGGLVWNIKGAYKKVLYAGGKLYALTEEGLLEVRNPHSDALLWSREEIQAISTDGTTIIEETKDRRFFRNAERGTLIEEQKKGTETKLPVLWRYGTAYAIDDTKLVPLYGVGKPWDAGEKILAAAADIRGGAVITENSLVLFDREMKETRRISYAQHSGIALSLTDEGVSVLDNGILRSYDREELTLQWTRRIDGAVPANGLEKTVIAGRDGLMVLNRYTGAVIWQDEKPYSSFALYHERIFASGTDGTIRAFNGAANVYGPVTEIRIEGDEGDEFDGWYTWTPEIEITAVDRETYVAGILMQLDDGPWEDDPAPFLPEDGEHRIRAYGVDSRGLRGVEVQRQFKIDTGLPESVLTLSSEEPESGWYNQALTLTLDAWDDVSGVDWIWTSISAYSGPIYLAAQGRHSFSWYALDKAGNREETQRRNIRIDLEPPYAEASAVYDQAMAELTITARDLLSGTAFIEYRINSGGTEQYREPLLFTEPGTYQVSYRAGDRAGNIGLWQTSNVVIAPNISEAVLINSPLINGMPRSVMSHARNGMPLIDAVDDGTIAKLPSYTLGAEYILWEEGDAELDESVRIRFQVKRNAVVYIFLPQNAAAPGSWAFVEDRVGINLQYYPGGAAVYMRRYGPSGWVEISGTPSGIIQPLIMVQEKGSVGADILINRETAELPVDSFTLEALVQPWQYSRRLPLRKRWFVNTGDGWTPLEGNRYEPPLDFGEEAVEKDISVPLRFRLELYTPDGEVEYRIEKVYGISTDFSVIDPAQIF